MVFRFGCREHEAHQLKQRTLIQFRENAAAVQLPRGVQTGQPDNQAILGPFLSLFVRLTTPAAWRYSLRSAGPPRNLGDRPARRRLCAAVHREPGRSPRRNYLRAMRREDRQQHPQPAEPVAGNELTMSPFLEIARLLNMITTTLTPDRSKIIIEHDDHVKYWTRHFGVTN